MGVLMTIMVVVHNGSIMGSLKGVTPIMSDVIQVRAIFVILSTLIMTPPRWCTRYDPY